nr:hypothetical protein [Tanacetum cinerariifolium]
PLFRYDPFWGCYNWDLLFQPQFDELLTPLPSVDPSAPEVIALIADVIPPVQAESTGSPSLTTVDQDAPSPSKSQTTLETQSPIIPQNVKENIHDIEVAHMGNDPLFGVPIPEVASAQSSSTVSPHIIVQPDHQIPQHNSKWTKDHPLDNIIGQLSRPVSTSVDPSAPKVIAPIADVIPPVQAESTETQSPIIPQDVKEDIHDIEVAHMGNDPLFGVPIPEVASAQSSSTVAPHIIVQPDNQIPQHNRK